MPVLQHHPLVHHAADGHRLDLHLGQAGRVERFAPAGLAQVTVVIARHQRDARFCRESLERVHRHRIRLADGAHDGGERARLLVLDGHVERHAERGQALARRVGGGEVEDVAEQDQLVVLALGDAGAEVGEAGALVGVAKHACERALAEVHVADHEQSHSAHSNSTTKAKAHHGGTEGTESFF